MNVLLWSLVLLCPLTSAERQYETEEDASALASGKQDTALEFGGKGLNSFKRLDASSKAGEPPPGDNERNVKPHQQQDAHAGQPMELYTMAKKVNDAQEELLRTHLDQLEGDSFAEQTEQMKREAANEQIPQSASLVELVDPTNTAAATATAKPEDAVATLQALAAREALKTGVDQKHVDDVPDITAEVAGIKGLKVQEYEPTQETAAKAIDTKYKTHRDEANVAWLATIGKIKTDEETKRAMFKAPDDKLHEKDMNLRYPEFLAAISTFQPDRLNSEKDGSVQKEAAEMMTSNDLANKETKVYADQMQKLADQTGEGYTKMGLNHFYGYDQIMGQIEEGHMVPGKAIRIAFPLENNINFEPNSNVFRGDSLKYINEKDQLPALIKDKVDQYKGFHFTFCIEASSTISKASLNKTSYKMNIVDYSHEGGITQKLGAITDEERRKGSELINERQKALGDAIETMLKAVPVPDVDPNEKAEKGLDSGTFHIVKPTAHDEEHHKRKMLLAAILMIAEDKDHRDYADGDSHELCNGGSQQNGIGNFDNLAANTHVMETIHSLYTNAGSDELATPDTDITKMIDQDTFAAAYKGLLELEKQCHETETCAAETSCCKGSKKHASVVKCLTHVNTETGQPTSESFQNIGTEEGIRPTAEFKDYMNEQMAYFCNVLSGLHEVPKDIAVVEPAKVE